MKKEEKLSEEELRQAKIDKWSGTLGMFVEDGTPGGRPIERGLSVQARIQFAEIEARGKAIALKNYEEEKRIIDAYQRKKRRLERQKRRRKST